MNSQALAALAASTTVETVVLAGPAQHTTCRNLDH
jgi:hypothetical protein